MKNFVGDFKKFINKGNIFDLATGIIIGTTFTAVVNSLVNDIVMPLISSAINFDLTSAKVQLREEIVELDAAGEEVITQTAIYLRYGAFIQNVINFLIIALAIYVAVTVVKRIKNGYIKSEIKYIKKLKARHPELFDEEDEYGTILYEKLKTNYPQYFKNELADEIEAQKAKANELTPQQINNELLARLNDNLEKMYALNNPEPAEEIKEENNEDKENVE